MAEFYQVFQTKKDQLLKIQEKIKKLEQEIQQKENSAKTHQLSAPRAHL